MSKKDLTEQEKEKQKDSIFIACMFYKEEIRNLTKDETELKERIKNIKDAIKDFNQSELITDKDTIICDLLDSEIQYMRSGEVIDFSEKRK